MANDQLSTQAVSFRKHTTYDNGQKHSGKVEMKFQSGIHLGDYGNPHKKIHRLIDPRY